MKNNFSVFIKFPLPNMFPVLESLNLYVEMKKRMYDFKIKQ